MSMGTFDEPEYERREKLIHAVETDSADERVDFEGHVSDTETTVEALLARFEELREN